jgi:hypothetical protein
LTGFAEINGTYEFDMRDGFCGQPQRYVIDIDGSEEIFNPSTFVWSTISTGGYKGLLEVQIGFWDFQILESSGTPAYYGNTVPDWRIGFRSGFYNFCFSPSDGTIIRGFTGTTVFQRTQTTSVLV